MCISYHQENIITRNKVIGSTTSNPTKTLRAATNVETLSKEGLSLPEKSMEGSELNQIIVDRKGGKKISKKGVPELSPSLLKTRL